MGYKNYKYKRIRLKAVNKEEARRKIMKMKHIHLTFKELVNIKKIKK